MRERALVLQGVAGSIKGPLGAGRLLEKIVPYIGGVRPYGQCTPFLIRCLALWSGSEGRIRMFKRRRRLRAASALVKRRSVSGKPRLSKLVSKLSNAAPPLRFLDTHVSYTTFSSIRTKLRNKIHLRYTLRRGRKHYSGEPVECADGNLQAKPQEVASLKAALRKHIPP